MGENNKTIDLFDEQLREEFYESETDFESNLEKDSSSASHNWRGMLYSGDRNWKNSGDCHPFPNRRNGDISRIYTISNNLVESPGDVPSSKQSLDNCSHTEATNTGEDVFPSNTGSNTGKGKRFNGWNLPDLEDLDSGYGYPDGLNKCIPPYKGPTCDTYKGPTCDTYKGPTCDTSNNRLGADDENCEVVHRPGSGAKNTHLEGYAIETNLESAGFVDVPFFGRYREGVLFDFVHHNPSEQESTVLYRGNLELHNGSIIRPKRLLLLSNGRVVGPHRVLDLSTLRLDKPRGSGSTLKRDKGISESDSDYESDSDDESDHESDDKEEERRNAFLRIPFFMEKSKKDLTIFSNFIPLIPTKKTNTDTRKRGDQWKKESPLVFDETKFKSHELNWWLQRKDQVSCDWFSDKVTNVCHQLAEVDWWRYWNQEDWDIVLAELLDDLDFEVEVEEEGSHKPYVSRIFSDQNRTGLSEAIETGFGELNGIPVALGVMEFEFIGGSMGHIVGERIIHLIEYASRLELPLIIVCASGGARLYEGTLSLMHMAKISSAFHYFEKENKKPFYISMLASPTTGGVTASFAMLGDIAISEPDALIAFAGKRVIEDTLKIEVPEGSQVSEVAFEKGLLDLLIPREMLKSVLSELLQLHNFLPLPPKTPKIKGLLS
uniref:Acetyl-CoA carboxylase beta subunit n=1 Tax=Passiflora filipes TaxID=298520 RepID=A0A4Y5QFT2_9ROSI|nr:acetyl-CoA carboxylase beta subunit [Passiflora filipes]QCX30490.1 acetyl-CoA carboxylase beta subunit [Passiflora filipes]